MFPILLAIILAFLSGSLPFSYLIGKVFFDVNLKEIGSGNPGATNLFRNVSRKAGIVALGLDALKGALPVLFLPSLLFPEGAAGLSVVDGATLVGLAAILGHVFTPFLKFRGGKGVATSLGAFLALAPVPVAIIAVVCLPIMIATRYVALGSVLGAIMFPVLVFILEEPSWLMRVIVVLIGVLIVVRHSSNIRRLLKGEESKI